MHNISTVFIGVLEDRYMYMYTSFICIHVGYTKLFLSCRAMNIMANLNSDRRLNYPAEGFF